MKKLFIIISSKYRRPVPSKFKEKLIENFRFRGSKIKPTKYQPQKLRNAAAKLTFIILNVPFINKSHVMVIYHKKMHYLKPDPSPK